MRNGIRFLTLAMLGLPGSIAAQTVTGIVRDPANKPLPGAEVIIENRSARADTAGRFRLDKLTPGMHPVVVRLIGYWPLRSQVVVSAREPTEIEFVLHAEPFNLPSVEVTASRTGIYGTVGDAGSRPLPGARVEVAGTNGGEMLADSAGRFAFSRADHGSYMVRITLPGYAEWRRMFEMQRGTGIELGVRMAVGPPRISRFEDEAIANLGRRLAINDPTERMTPSQLAQYESEGLCDVNRITQFIGRDPAATVTLIVNGYRVIEEFPVRALCLYRANEVDLVEFGSSVCRDLTRTFADLLNTWCSGIPPKAGPRRAVRSMVGGGQPVQKGGGGFVAIWEKR